MALNLVPQPGETEGFSPHRHLEVLADHAPSLSFDVVLADAGAVAGAEDELKKAAEGSVHASLVLADVAAADGRGTTRCGWPRRSPAGCGRGT